MHNYELNYAHCTSTFHFIDVDPRHPRPTRRVSSGIPRNSVGIFPRNSVKFRGIPRHFSRNSAEFNSAGKIPRNSTEFLTEFSEILFCRKKFSAGIKFRGIPWYGIQRNTEFRRKNSAEFHGFFRRNFYGIPYKKFDGNIIPPEFFLTE